MIFQMLYLLMIIMMVNSVISAPGPMDAANDLSRTRKRKPRPMRSGTLDSLGGGNILRADTPDTKDYNFRSLELLLSYQDNIPQNMVLIAREGKQKPSSSGTLDPIGRGNFVRLVDSDIEAGAYRSLESLLENQADAYGNMFSLPREEGPKHSASGTLDSIGGGHLLGIVDPDADTEIFRSLVSRLENQDHNLPSWISLAREDKQNHSASGTLDSIGGGHLLRIVDPDADTEIFRSLVSRLETQDNILQNKISISRTEKQKPSSSGVLDPLGGDNFVRVVDPGADEEFFRSFQSLLNNQEDSTVSFAREDKLNPSSSGTLDPIGGGNLVRVVDPRVDEEFLRSLTLSNQDGSTVSLTREDKQKPSSSGTLDPIGGGNLVRVVDPGIDEVVFRSLPLNTEDDKTFSLAREDKQKPSSSGTLDPIGGGNLVRIVDSELETEVVSSLESLTDNQDDVQYRENKPTPKPQSLGTLDPIGGDSIVRAYANVGVFRTTESFADSQGRQNMMRLAREDKSSQRSSSHALDGLGGGVAGPYRGQLLQSHLTNSLDQGDDVLRMLDSISGRDLLSSLDSAEGMAVLSALRKTHTKYPKRMLDSVSGWAFGESKRNFDEIDNVGFTGFAKRSPRYRQLALAKKNFDEIDRAGFETYNKRDFDEIDRAGFETFEKRDRKE